MNHGRRLVELCETWWEESAPTQSALREVAAHYLRCLGWEHWDSAETEAAWSVFVSAGEEERLAFAFVMPGDLEPSSKVVELGLDYGATTRAAVRTCAAHGADHVLVTDLSRAYLYDVASDELLLHADSPQLFLREIFDEVTRECVDEGGLAEMRHPPRSAMARQLREWQQRWVEEIAGQDEELLFAAWELMDQMVIARYILDSDVTLDGSEELACAMRAVFRGEAAGNVAPCWGHFCQHLFTRHGISFFKPCGRQMRLTSDEPRLATLFGEFARMSRSKFAIPCVLESFNFGEAAEKARVRLVPDPDPEREKMLASQALDTLGEFKLEIDVLEEGYRAIGYWFGQLVGVYRRLGVPVRSSGATKHDAMALLDWSEGSDNETPSTTPQPDALTRAIEDGLCIYYQSDRQLRTASLLLHLYAVDLHRKYGASVGRFPQIQQAFVERPTLLEREKQWIYEPPSDHASGGWES